MKAASYRDELNQSTDDAAVIARAKARFDRAMQWEGEFLTAAADDIKFVVGDGTNNYQWPALMRESRLRDKRPCLTMNKVHQHWLSVVNDGKQNKPSVTIHPTSEDASYLAAQAFEKVIRHIEYISNAQAAYDKASEYQVACGVGYWRVTNEYGHDNSFDQQIFIRPVPDATQVLLDPMIKESDGSDAKFGIVYTEMAKADFIRAYPDHEDAMRDSAIGQGGGWLGDDKVRVAEYYEVREIKDTLYAIMGPNGVPKYLQRSDMTPEEIESVKDRADEYPRRSIKRREVWKYLIAGNTVLDKGIVPCKYIPIVRVIGEEMIVDGKLERKGLVRYMIDAQRMYNYNTSAQVEAIALQTKVPFVAPLGAIDGLEQYWNTANTVNHSVLPYNSADENGNPIPAPTRSQPPSSGDGYTTGMQAAAEEMRMTSGQYDAMVGAPSNETAGVAIQQRQRQGDRATYHFIDGLSKAIRFTGKILIDMIPRVLDTKRLISIMEDDGTKTRVMIDNNAQQATVEMKTAQGEVTLILNPSIGEYDVTSDVGPSYQTQREQAFDAMQSILATNPALTQVIGDLFFKAADFPMADEMAERMQRWIPPSITGQAPSPQEQQMQQQMQQMQMQLQKMQAEALQKDEEIHSLRMRGTVDLMKVSDARVNQHLERELEARQKAIDEYRAETDRLKVLSDQFAGIAGMDQLKRQEGAIIDNRATIDGISRTI